MANEVVIHVKADDDASGKLDKLQGKASGLGNVLGTAVKAGALAGGAAVIGFGVASINAAANFEHAVDQVGAVANATKQEMDGLSKKALQIGKDTMFGATEAAQAMEILAANGVSATDIMGGAADAAIALAAAGGTDLKTAADVASTAMSVWGLKTKDMTDVVNRLTGAANVSRFGVEDMAMAVAQGGGAAKTAGVEFGDFATAIAAIAPSFSSGADAGTSLKTMMVGLTGSSGPAREAMRDLGLITDEAGNRFFDSKGQLKSFADVTQILHDATKKLTEEQRTQALAQIFGTDAMRAAAAISAMTGEEFQKMSDTMKNTDAQVVAAQRMDNFKGSMDGLKGSIETVMIQIGMELLPVLTDLSKWLSTEGIPAFTEWAEEAIPKVQAAFEDLKPTLLDFLDAFQLGLETLQPLVEDLFNFIIDNKPALIIAIAAIGAAVVLAFGPASTAAVAIAGIITALGLIKQSFADARAEAEKEPDVSGWKGFLIGLDREIRGFGEGISALLSGEWSRAWELFARFVEATWRGIVYTLEGDIVLFKRLGGLLADAIASGFRAAWNAIADAINSAIPNSIGFPSVTIAGIEVFGGGGIDLPDNPLPRLQRGGDVLKTGLAVVHEGERYISPGMGGGGTTIHNHFNINALDGESVRRLIPQIAYELQVEMSRSR